MIPITELLPEPRLSIKDAMRLSSFSRTTIWRAIKGGRLRAVSAGRRTLIPADSLKEWLDGFQTYEPHVRGGSITSPAL